MKIKVVRDGDPIKVYHHPREVIVRPEKRIVEIYNDSIGGLYRRYRLLNHKLDWLENKDSDTAEIFLELNVGETLFRMEDQ